jgi:hypothetical protein
MTKTTVRTAVGLLLGVTLLLLASSPAPAEGDFDGKWTMNANGWTFVLRIQQNGDTITGTMRGINNDERNKIEGKIDGNKITFTRDNGQEYRGFLFTDDPSGKGAAKLAMAGTARSGEDHFGWYATR